MHCQYSGHLGIVCGPAFILLPFLQKYLPIFQYLLGGLSRQDYERYTEANVGRDDQLQEAEN